ncbi:hypothetical protein [Actinophytocola xanthii]|uniref:Uncharacterized protein n=1 Tax=Actinophytocola xanthii TaxID=1912961 RepID=A0A1Q8CPX7_9PSEU|nr:hypothetical protein [Actinophytocola xanthii]OLF16412.1 hypothetical protein BU204_16295 [Actinophytocola xanthii]
MLRQLVGTWLVGSVLTGTLAVLFTLDRGELPLTPLAELPVQRMLGVLGLLAALFAALVLLGLSTADASWLPGDGRGVTLWVVLVGTGGFAGWAYAAAVTFAAEFALGTQLVLAYACGGLPFALVAAMLVRPVTVNAVAVGLAAVSLLVGAGLVAGPGLAQECLTLLTTLFHDPLSPSRLVVSGGQL